MNAIRGVIFDCDGVLFESRQANLAYYNTVLEQLGIPPVTAADRERAHVCHTAASPRVFEILLGPDRAEEALVLARDLDYRRFIPEMIPEPDLQPSLARLASRLPLAVATNRGNSMDQILGHFGLRDFFRQVVTSRDVERPKPYPDMLLRAAAGLELPCEALLFIGDSELDRDAARAAGVRFLAYQGKVEGAPAVGGHRELVDWLEGEKGEVAGTRHEALGTRP